MKQTTLCYILRDNDVLLAMKKRGLGMGKWNGPGGKKIDEETIEDACRRETFEETGVNVGALERRGVVRFCYSGHPDWTNECAIFISRDFSGEPMETEEMNPKWFPIDGLPMSAMWESDAIWLQDVLTGGSVDLTVYFDDEDRMQRYEQGGTV